MPKLIQIPLGMAQNILVPEVGNPNGLHSCELTWINILVSHLASTHSNEDWTEEFPGGLCPVPTFSSATVALFYFNSSLAHSRY